MAERNSKMLKCDECDHEFRKESNFNFHKDALHKDLLISAYFREVGDIETKFKCELCETKIETEEDLNKHKIGAWCYECNDVWNCDFHFQRSKCTKCNEELSCKLNYEAHWYHEHTIILRNSNDVALENTIRNFGLRLEIEEAAVGVSGLDSVKLTSLGDLLSSNDEIKIKEAFRSEREVKEARELREKYRSEEVSEKEVDDIIHCVRDAVHREQIYSSIPKHIKNACYSALKGMDQAFIAGILRTFSGEEREDSKN